MEVSELNKILIEDKAKQYISEKKSDSITIKLEKYGGG